MFTGIIETIGCVARIDRREADLSLTIVSDTFSMSDVALGDSICCSGVCLTVTALLDNGTST